MSVSNFELDITSRVAAGDESGEAPSGLVWQPTLTLWQRGETAAIVRDSSAALGDSPVPSYAAVERAQTRDPTAATGVATIIPVGKLSCEEVPTVKPNAIGGIYGAATVRWRRPSGATHSIRSSRSACLAHLGRSSQILRLLAFSPPWSRCILVAPWYFSVPSGGRRSAIRSKGVQHFGAASRAPHR